MKCFHYGKKTKKSLYPTGCDNEATVGKYCAEHQEKPEPKRCKKQMWRNWNSVRCSRTATNGDYCKQHSPETVAARRKAEQEKYEKKSQQFKIEQATVKAFPIFLKALTCISDGSSEPMQVAADAISKYQSLIKPEKKS